MTIVTLIIPNQFTQTGARGTSVAQAGLMASTRVECTAKCVFYKPPIYQMHGFWHHVPHHIKIFGVKENTSTSDAHVMVKVLILCLFSPLQCLVMTSSLRETHIGLENPFAYIKKINVLREMLKVHPNNVK